MSESGTGAPFLVVFVSMFAAGTEGGMRAFLLDPLSGTITPAAGRWECPNAFFVTLSEDQRRVYALTAVTFGDASTEEVIAWRIVGRDGVLAPLGRTAAAGAATCFITAAPGGRTLLLAHYTGGTVATLPLSADGGFAGPPITVPLTCGGSGVVKGRQEASHPHALVFAPAAVDGPQFVYAADLGGDAICCYRLDLAVGRLTSADQPVTKTAAGAGPRHLAFHPDGRRLYVINELNSTVGVYDLEAASGQLTERQTISTLPKDFVGTNYAADVRLTPCGGFLYGTNRGHDSLATYAIAADGRLALVEIVTSRGRGPQSIAITPDGGLLLCANMPGDSLAIFRIDRATGRLTPVGEPVPVTAPSSIAITNLVNRHG